MYVCMYVCMYARIYVSMYKAQRDAVVVVVCPGASLPWVLVFGGGLFVSLLRFWVLRLAAMANEGPKSANKMPKQSATEGWQLTFLLLVQAFTYKIFSCQGHVRGSACSLPWIV